MAKLRQKSLRNQLILNIKIIPWELILLLFNKICNNMKKTIYFIENTDSLSTLK